MSEPGNPAVLHRRGIELLQKNRIPEAAKCFSEVLNLAPDHPGATHYFGIALVRRQRFDEALPWLEKSIELRPRVAEFHHNLGAAYRALGRFPDAGKAYRTALDLKPDYAEAWFNYSAAWRFGDDDSALAQIRSQLETAGLSRLDREYLHFAAGKICDDQERYEEAFAHYDAANRLRGHEFDREGSQTLVERLESVFSEAQLAAFAEKEIGSQSEEPVFVVGMPRSGTTLAEQILASHPEIEGAGELPDIMAISRALSQHTGGREYPENVTALPDSAFGELAQHYLNLRQALRTDRTRRVVDKMPGNFLHVGLIHCLFPRARVIHCVRDPRDTCLSCFFHRFRTGHLYASKLEDLGRYYRNQERVTRHWKAVMPEKIFTLDYEELIDEPERITRELLAFCGVDWDEACLRFHETKRAVATASNFQVRRPLNRRGLARWKRYEAHLGPLTDALERFALPGEDQ